ncbi:methionine ABC transporter substrate-binding protein, partial [Treponema pallidum]
MKGKTVSAALVGKLIALSVGVVACTQVKDETV